MSLTTKILAFIGKKVLRVKPLYPSYRQKKDEIEKELFCRYGKGSRLVHEGLVYSSEDLFAKFLRR